MLLFVPEDCLRDDLPDREDLLGLELPTPLLRAPVPPTPIPIALVFVLVFEIDDCLIPIGSGAAIFEMLDRRSLYSFSCCSNMKSEHSRESSRGTTQDDSTIE